jgi:hypothetical protein
LIYTINHESILNPFNLCYDQINTKHDIYTYRVNNTICHIPGSSSHLKSKLNFNQPKTTTQDVKNHPVCLQTYPDSNFFFKSPFFSLQNYNQSRYIFPHHTYQQTNREFTPFTTDVELLGTFHDDDDDDFKIEKEKELPLSDCQLDNLISQQTPYTSTLLIEDTIAQLNHIDGTNNCKSSNHNNNFILDKKYLPNTELSSLLSEYPPIFSLSYHSFYTNSQHESEPVVRYHVPSCNQFRKNQLEKSKSIFFNPLFLFQLYDINPFSRSYKNTSNESDPESYTEAYLQLIQQVSKKLIDIDLCHDITPYLRHIDHQNHKSMSIDPLPTDNNNVKKTDQVIAVSTEICPENSPAAPSSPLLGATRKKKKIDTRPIDERRGGANHKGKPSQGGEEKRCKCSPCPDLVEYYVFMVKSKSN